MENTETENATPKNLSHFAYGCDENTPIEIDIVVNEHGKVVVFHDKVFREDIGWFECDLDRRKFLFVFDNGESVDAGITVSDDMKKYMQNSHQILTVLLDHETGDAKEGFYYPLILQKA